MHATNSAWTEYRRRNRLASLGLLGLPGAAVVAIAAGLLLHLDTGVLFVGLTVVWCGWWGWAAFRAVRCPCPRCGVAYLAGQDPWARQCGHCGLPLYADL
jgi:hypothetical protein